MLLFASLWLFSPFATGALLGSSPRARRLAGRYYPVLLTLGLTGIALVVLGAFVLARPFSFVALVLGGPLSGLSFWVKRTDGGDDGRGPDEDEPEPPPPGGDWERIVEQFERHVERHRGGPVSPGGDLTPEPASPSPALV